MNDDKLFIEDIIKAGDKFDVDNLEDVYEIDLENIDLDAGILATGKINNLLRLYNDKDFVEQNPEFKKRIDNEIDTLRRLIKLAKTNEVIHDNLAKAISHNPNNASLYMALARLQSNIMSIQTQINTTMNDFTKLCKSYQTEMNFDRPVDEATKSTDNGTISRGRKAFIETLKNEIVERVDDVEE